MSKENLEFVGRGYEYFAASRDFDPARMHPEFVWDMSTFRSWPEQQTYEGLDGARRFMADWIESWEDWDLQLVELLDAGDEGVLAILHQSGRSKATGLEVEMDFAQLWEIRGGKQARMRMYADLDEARRAAGISG
jgi:ketosteroid isomerase-like protein